MSLVENLTTSRFSPQLKLPPIIVVEWIDLLILIYSVYIIRLLVTQVALELLSAVTVKKVMKIAREVSGVSDKSTSEAELNFSPSTTSSRARQHTADTTQTATDTREDSTVTHTRENSMDS
mgnify:CR=1 FL=1